MKTTEHALKETKVEVSGNSNDEVQAGEFRGNQHTPGYDECLQCAHDDTHVALTHNTPEAHTKAAESHRAAAKKAKPGPAREYHDKQAEFHDHVASKRTPAYSSSAETPDVIQCRSSGAVMPANAQWALDVPVSFQWMPGGVTTIEATWNGKPIQLTVDCDDQTAAVVQASLDEWRGKYPKQKPFGCVEHREEEAAVFPVEFAWHDEPEPGVYCSATPTALGVRNVNGRIHRSWSPSFTTDAEYGKCQCSSCSRKISACECDAGMAVFPKGARGHADSPASVTGVAFSIGSLTNKPAFKNIAPVRARNADGSLPPVKPDASTIFSRLASLRPATVTTDAVFERLSGKPVKAGPSAQDKIFARLSSGKTGSPAA